MRSYVAFAESEAAVMPTLCEKNVNLIYDVGLHKGEDTAFYLAKGFDVVAFEADPTLAQLCREKFADAIESQRLIIVEGAVVDESRDPLAATVTYYQNQENSAWGTIVGNWADRNEVLGAPSQRITVATVKMSECLRRFGVPYYMKIDIEGADLFCLQALQHCDVRPHYVSLESEKRVFKRLANEFRLLDALGYTRFKIVEQSTISGQSAPQPAREGIGVQHCFEEGASGVFGLELPGRWRSRGAALLRYFWIFGLYRVFGDYGVLRRSATGDIIKRVLARVLRQPIPGWYDTHACHDSVVDS